MTKLRKQLEGMIAKHGKKTWKLSSSDEPGEGEHKLIREWRTGKYAGNYAVYGLDADLIVLSMLGHETASLGNKIWLFREEVQAGKIAYDASGEEEFEWFSVSALSEWLCGGKSVGTRQFVLDYCFAMSVLGNDFLPSSLGLKIREDGHGELMDVLARLHQQGVCLVDQEFLSLRIDGLLELFRLLAADEAQRITKYVSKKQYASRNMAGDRECVVGDNDWPMYHMEEDVLLGTGRKLVEDWQSVYLLRFFPGFHSSDMGKICKEYLYGIQWIWAYYTGRHADVCYDWCYSFSLPPLWIWIHAYLLRESGLPAFPEQVLVRADDILPVEQLALVLPLESWSLLPPCPQRALPYLAPHLFPASFSFDSVGKRFFWECESLIPLPSIEAIKHIVASAPLL
jgi:5'-3' exonuclease